MKKIITLISIVGLVAFLMSCKVDENKAWIYTHGNLIQNKGNWQSKTDASKHFIKIDQYGNFEAYHFASGRVDIAVKGTSKYIDFAATEKSDDLFSSLFGSTPTAYGELILYKDGDTTKHLKLSVYKDNSGDRYFRLPSSTTVLSTGDTNFLSGAAPLPYPYVTSGEQFILRQD